MPVLEFGELKVLLRPESHRHGRFGSIHLLKNGVTYECTAIRESNVKIFDFEKIGPTVLKDMAERRNLHKIKRVKFEDQMAKWREENEENKKFAHPADPLLGAAESRLFFAIEPDRFPGIRAQLVSQEEDGDEVALLFRMELPWREVVYGAEVDFVSACNTRMAFERVAFQ